MISSPAAWPPHGALDDLSRGDSPFLRQGEFDLVLQRELLGVVLGTSGLLRWFQSAVASFFAPIICRGIGRYEASGDVRELPRKRGDV